MINNFSDFLKLIDDAFIKGVFLSIITVIFCKRFLNNQIETIVSAKILKWTLIIHAIVVIINTLILFFFRDSENALFLSRATGQYWWIYLFMLTMNSVVPLFLLNKKLGDNLYFMLIVGILINLGWIFESFVIHVTSINADYGDKNYYPYIPTSREISILVTGFLIGLASLTIENSFKIVKFYKLTKKE